LYQSSARAFSPLIIRSRLHVQTLPGCTIGAEHWLQVGGQSAAGNRWAICTNVDGSLQALCPFQGYVPSDGTYATGSFNLAVAVSLGTHTFQEVLYTDAGAEIGDYNNTYHRYKP
jgi:hypothetical protein